MDSTWEAEFSNSRHVHNRRSRKPKSQTANISHIFGAYQIQCPKAESIAPGHPLDTKRDKPKRHSGPRLTVQGFTADEHGLVGSLHLPGVLDAEIHMSGSRKKLQEILDAEVAEDDSDSEEGLGMRSDHQHNGPESEATLNNTDSLQQSDAAASSYGGSAPESSAQENREQLRFRNFEKNTFRQPKFWLFWKGIVIAVPENAAQASADNLPDSSPNEPQSGMGYVVFSGNNKYKRFRGVISCEYLGWKDVAISGRKE